MGIQLWLWQAAESCEKLRKRLMTRIPRQHSNFWDRSCVCNKTNAVQLPPNRNSSSFRGVVAATGAISSVEQEGANSDNQQYSLQLKSQQLTKTEGQSTPKPVETCEPLGICVVKQSGQIFGWSSFGN